MKAAIVSSGEIFDPDKNPTRCLSAARYTGGCYNCHILRRMMQRYGLEEALNRIVCKPIVSPAVIELHNEKENLQARIAEIRSEIGGLDEEIEQRRGE